MKTMKNKVNRELTETWLGKSLIRVGQKVDEVWMGVGQYLVRSWSAFKAKVVGQKLDESWTELLQPYSSITPKITGQRLLQLFSNTSPEIKRFSLKKVPQQLPNAYPENEGFSLNKSGQHQDGIGIENCVKVSSWVRQFGGYKVGQFLGETCVDLGPFYPETNLVIQPLSFIIHSLIVHNKRVQDKWLDVPELFLYVVLPDQNL